METRLRKHFLRLKSKHWLALFLRHNLDLEFKDPFKKLNKLPIMEKTARIILKFCSQILV